MNQPMNPAPTPRTDSTAFTLAYDEEEVGEIVGSDFARQLERELAEAKAENQWRPIETAPKDGTHIDLWVSGEFPGRYPDAYFGMPPHECGEYGPYCDSDWHSAKPGWVCGTFGEFICTMESPTHWRPLPTPPKS